MTDRTTTIRVNGIDVHHRVAGDGDPLVLVHGSWTDADSWRFVAPQLTDSYRVLTYDRRGHSRTERPAAPGSRRQDEDDLIALLQALDHAPAHVVASSYGGSIAVAVAGRRPDLVRSVAVHEPPLVSLLDEADAAAVADVFEPVAALLRAGETEAGARRFIEEVALGPGSWPTLPDEARATYVGNAPTFLDTVDDPGWADVDLDALAATTVPLLVTDGETSTWFLRACAAALAERTAGARRHTFADAGHAPHLTHAADYAAVIGSFAAACSATVG